MVQIQWVGIGVLVLLFTDGLLYSLGRIVQGSDMAQSMKGIPILVMLPLTVVALAIHAIGLLFSVGLAAGNSLGFVFLLILSLFTTYPFAIIFSVLLRNSLSDTLVGELAGLSRDATPLVNLAAARKLTREGKFEAAMEEYRRSHDEFPDSPDPLFGLAFLLIQSRRFEEAADGYREIIKRFHSDDIVWEKASRLLMELLREELEDKPGADYILSEITRRNPDSRYDYTSKSSGRMNEPSPSKKNSSDPISDLNRARRLSKQGRVVEAVELFERYGRANPKKSRPFFEAATAYSNAGRHDDAVRKLQEIIRRFSGSDGAWGDAMLRLATIQESEMNDIHAAKFMLEQVNERLKHREEGRIARDRLRELIPKLMGS